jgi:5-bromo-4-chloroindolyl phosphate hydrolysis protein
MQEQVIQNINDEFIIAQFSQMFKNIFINIFIFIICIFLFLNPVLLVNALLFISIFICVKSSLSYFFEDKNSSPIETEIKINFDESELLKDRIRHLKKENSILKDRIERTDRKHKKKEKIHVFRTEKKKPFKINVEFPDNEFENEVETKVENEVEKEIEKEIEKEEEKEVETLHHQIDFDKIISDVINEMINSDTLKDDGFAILSKTPNNSVENSSEDEQ